MNIQNNIPQFYEMSVPTEELEKTRLLLSNRCRTSRRFGTSKDQSEAESGDHPERTSRVGCTYRL